jgi:hypothetical protein
MQNIKNLLEGLDTKDPKIKASDNIIGAFPNYWNYSFISIVFGFFFGAIVYIFFIKKDDRIEPWFLIAIISLLLAMILELKYYNSIIINFSEKSISIIPNLILRPFIKKRIFFFKEVEKFEIMLNIGFFGSPTRYRRHIIGLVLKKSNEIKILSTDNYLIAKEITNRLTLILKS